MWKGTAAERDMKKISACTVSVSFDVYTYVCHNFDQCGRHCICSSNCLVLVHNSRGCSSRLHNNQLYN